MASKYYSFSKIDKTGATYRLVIGQRSNGKTYGACKKILDTYIKTGKPSVYVRRMEEMIRPMNIEGLFNPHESYIEEQTEHKYNRIIYRQHKYYLARFDETDSGKFIKTAQDINPFCINYAISTVETTKGTDPGEIAYVLFDEFITRQFYLANEFIKFQNLLSSVIRDRPGVVIYMLANTVSKHCPYFRDMGLYRIASQEITKGSWEIAMYRHAPANLKDHPIILTFFVVFDGKTVQGDIYMYKEYPLIFWHPKTTPIKKPEETIIYMEDHEDANPLHQIDLRAGTTRAQKLIFDLCRQRKTFFSDNETGEVIAAWIKTAVASSVKVAI